MLCHSAPEASRGRKVLIFPETKENSRSSLRAEHLRTVQVDVRETVGSRGPAETSADTVVWQPEYERNDTETQQKNKKTKKQTVKTPKQRENKQAEARQRGPLGASKERVGARLRLLESTSADRSICFKIKQPGEHGLRRVLCRTHAAFFSL